MFDRHLHVQDVFSLGLFDSIIVSHNCSYFDFNSSVLGESRVSFPYHSKVWSFRCCWWLHQGNFQCFLFLGFSLIFSFFFFNLVWLLRVMDVLASPSQPMLLLQRKYLELMQAVGLLIWCIPLWACSLLVRGPNISFLACFVFSFYLNWINSKHTMICTSIFSYVFFCQE